jgi:hypothetical protein
MRNDPGQKPADLVRKFRALAEAHRSRASAAEDNGWRQIHSGLADTYAALASESEWAADYTERVERVAAKRREG